MNIRKKTLTIVGVFVMVLVAALTTVSYYVVTGRFARLEIKETQARVHHVQNEVQSTMAFLESTAADWAPWDDTYQFIQDANQDYIDNNLVDSTFTNLHLRFMLFFNDRAELVYSRFHDLNPSRTAVDQAAVIEAIGRQSTPSLLSHAHEENRVSGILMVRSIPYLVTAHPIVTSKFEGPIRGSLILGRALDADEIQRIGAITKTALIIGIADSRHFKLPTESLASALKQAGIHAVPLSSHTMVGYATIDDLNRAPALILEITRDRDIYRYGLVTWGQNAAAMFALGLLFIGMLMFVLDRAILNRLRDLAGKVHELAGTANCIKRLDIRSSDEFGQLADSIDTMLDALQRYHALQMDSEKRHLSALRHSEERYRRFFEEDLTGDVLTTAAGAIIDCNRSFAKILGYHSTDALKSLNAGMFYQRASQRKVLLERLCKEKKLERVELELKDRDGNPIYCIGNLIGHFDEAGNLTEIISYLFDDTKRVHLENDLRQAQKLEAIGTMAGGIAHDFNNILAGIMGYAELTLNDLPTAGRPAERLKKILTATHRAKELVQQILTFSRQSESDPRPLELTPIIEEALNLLRASLPTTIDIRRRLEAHPTVIADPVQIHQVMMNLCTNAAHAMKHNGGTLTISITEEVLSEAFTEAHPGLTPGAFGCIGVEDTGTGISPAVKDRIFDPFFTTKSKTEGTGLGLSAVHGIVSKLGGVVTVASSSQGSRFDVYLPCAQTSCELPRQEAESIPLGSEAIVIVDDEAFQVDVGTQMLESLGYQVAGFTDSIEALNYITECAGMVDLVITDMTMPRLTGLSLSGKLMDLFPHLPIILCSGFSEEITAEKAFAAGIRGFVAKPVLPMDLARKMREILDFDTHPGHGCGWIRT